MGTKIVPEAVRNAAKRAFIRTTAQAYSTALAGGLSATAILTVFEPEQPWIPLIITWVVAVLSPMFAGAASYLSILSEGIPDAYVEAANLEPVYVPQHKA